VPVSLNCRCTCIATVSLHNPKKLVISCQSDNLSGKLANVRKSDREPTKKKGTEHEKTRKLHCHLYIIWDKTNEILSSTVIAVVAFTAKGQISLLHFPC